MFINTKYNQYISYFNLPKNDFINNNWQIPKQSAQSGSQTVKPIDYSGVNYAMGLKNGAIGLKNAVNSLQSSQSSAAKQVYISSDTEKMTLQTNGKFVYNASDAPTSVRIEQLASGQMNKGMSLASDEKVVADNVGKHQISIESGGKTYQVSFDVKSEDTNRDMLNKMVDAINKANTGVTASVITNSIDKTVALNIESAGVGTGNEGTFKIKDVSGKAVALTGADEISRQAQDAIYYINGGAAKTSKSNTVDIGGGITATFKTAGTQDIKITKGIDTDSVISDIKRFADTYNNLFKLTRDNGDMGEKLFTKLVSISKTYAQSMSKLGIEFNKSGEMTIDETKIAASAKDGSLERFLSGRPANTGFLNQLSRLSDDVRFNAGKYIDRSSVLSNLISSTGGGFQTASSQYDLTGLLFNYLV